MAKKQTIGYKRRKKTKDKKSKVRGDVQESFEMENVGKDFGSVAEDPLNESDVEEFDLEYIEKHGGQHFLADLDNTNNTRRKRRKTQQEDEAEFEKRPRVRQGDVGNEELHYLLPIRNQRKIVQQTARIITVQRENEAETLIEEGTKVKEIAVNKVENDNEPIDSIAQLFARRQRKLSQKKDAIAGLAHAIVANPERNIGYLKDLRELCKEEDLDVALTTRKLAMMSMVEVLKDILPSYRIRTPSEKEKNLKVSKDVKKLRVYEDALLNHYQQFLNVLEEFVLAYMPKRKQHKLSSQESSPDVVTAKTLALIAVRCLCRLIESLSHFNYRNNILTILVQLLNSNDEELSKCSYQALKTMYKDDHIGEVSLEAVRLTAKMIKSNKFNVKEKVLETFLALNLAHTQHLGETNQKEISIKEKRAMRRHEKKGKSRKELKKQRETKRLHRELLEAEASESDNKKSQFQTEILNAIFSIYFRTIKYGSKARLLSPVLMGLAKFGHLINIDFFNDLMVVLEKLLKSQLLPTEQKIHCILTAIKILSGQGEVLNVDPHSFYLALYGTLLELPIHGYKNDFVALLRCLELMLVKRRKQVTAERMLAFIKRLCSVCLLLIPNEIIGLESLIRTLLQVYPKSQGLLDGEATTGKVFLPDVDQPELSYADSTVLWELTLLKRHYHPTVSTYSKHLAFGAPSVGQGSLHASMTHMDPISLYEEFSFSHGNFCPSFPEEKQGCLNKNLK